MDISVILPAYNEEASIVFLLEGLYKELGRDIEIIVVDDCSSDRTGDLAKDCGAKVVKNFYNMGNGACIKRGIREAKSNIIVLMDSDGQHQPRDISKLIKFIDNYDMIIGQRSGADQVFWRRAVNKIYNILASYVTGVEIGDLTSGFRIIKKNKAVKFLYLLPNTFSYPTTLTLGFIKTAYSVKFVPIDVLPRKKGKSKINLLSDGFRFFIIITKIAVFFAPLKVFIPVSISFFLLGICYYLYTFVNFHRFTNMSALFIITAVIVFMLGLISEQISSMRMEKTEE